MIDQELLLISGIQHFAFCPRQWALIHVEQQWSENVRTVDGQVFHNKAHTLSHELRGDILIIRGLRVASMPLKITGTCDIVEFHRDKAGVPLASYDGLWIPFPVEYKKGEPKLIDADRLQLCAQAMCLEEMLHCPVNEGALFYGETRRRENVAFTQELRQEVSSMLGIMSQYYDKGYTPPPRDKSSCSECSLNDICIPRLAKVTTVTEYINSNLGDTL